MKATNQRILILLTCIALFASAYAQSPRGELKQLVEQLQKVPADDALREKIIRPERVDRNAVRAITG